MRKAHVVKLSDDESEFLTGIGDPKAACRALWCDDLKLMVVTRGRAGCVYFTPEFSGEVASFAVEAVDATGAGDGFMADLLQGLLTDPDTFRDEARLRELCRFANAVGALTTLQRGKALNHYRLEASQLKSRLELATVPYHSRTDPLPDLVTRLLGFSTDNQDFET